jgi:C1A family cysteine protease
METLYGKLQLSESGSIAGIGWLPPKPDLRDYTQHKKEIKEFSKKLGLSPGRMKLPASVDLRKWCSPVENQGSIGSCTAQAAAGWLRCTMGSCNCSNWL